MGDHPLFLFGLLFFVHLPRRAVNSFERLVYTNARMSIERDERPWGMYEVLVEGNGYKVKRIEVKPGHRLSLQMHQSRSEHWVIVAGEAIVTVGERETRSRANDDTLIPPGTKHRIANPGVDSLVFIEVQCGAYLGEDDITRFEDDYNRNC